MQAQGNLVIVDVLRGLSAQAVLLGHYHALLVAGAAQEPVSWLTRFVWRAIHLASAGSHQAVMVFFLLSGFLVGSQVLRQVADGEFRYGDYMLRRLARLYSVILPGLVLTWLAVQLAFGAGHGWEWIQQNRPWYPAWFDPAHSNSVSTLACNLAGLQMIACYQYGHNLALWSLSNELLYYIAFPSLVLLATAGRIGPRAVHAVAALAVGILMASGTTPNDPDRTLIYYNGFVIWSAGALLPGALARWSRLHPAGRWALFAAVLAVSLLICWRAASIHLQDYGVAGLAVCALAAASALPQAARRGAGARAMAHLASYSYTLYFIHLPLLLVAVATVTWPLVKIGQDGRGAAMFLGACVAANLAAWLFYLPFERRYRAVYRYASALAARLGLARG